MAIKMYMLKMAKKKKKGTKKSSRTKAVTHSGVRLANPNHFEQP